MEQLQKDDFCKDLNPQRKGRGDNDLKMFKRGKTVEITSIAIDSEGHEGIIQQLTDSNALMLSNYTLWTKIKAIERSSQQWKCQC